MSPEFNAAPYAAVDSIEALLGDYGSQVSLPQLNLNQLNSILPTFNDSLNMDFSEEQ